MVIILNGVYYGGMIMYLLIVVLIILVVLFFPIKLKITCIYQDAKIHVYIFNKQFKLKEKVSERKTNKENVLRAERFIKKLLPKDIVTSVKILNRNKFKPKIDVYCSLSYGFDDAAFTGFSFGILQSLSSIIYTSVGMIFKVKSSRFNVNPQFNNSMLNFRISSIISINLVKIIYMVYILFSQGGEPSKS
jgi:hypothetical protein